MTTDSALFATVQAEVRAASRALILPGFARTPARRKRDGSVVTDIDLAMQTRLISALDQASPGVPLLGEEMEAAQQQEIMDSATRYWVLDPLDGTSNFVAGLPFFSTALALVDGGDVRAGLVYDPIRDEMFSADARGCASLNGMPLSLEPDIDDLRQSVAVVDFKRLPNPLAGALAQHPPYRSQRNLGSVALEWCWLAAGRFQLYLHGGQKLWDYAAGDYLLRCAGGAVSTLAGPAPGLSLAPRSAVAACGPGLHQQWANWLCSQ